ncbi:hypothetical protein E3U43_011321 [Larimichthys crocea]|uniref:Uncharacterized protein n=1 Tax=Larimichthys crocea TaxID=215358 RepID=A0ACD3QJE1_LARCR|nr:hypothetical protein E3U43_011321 [Larimichthys crocea]
MGVKYPLCQGGLQRSMSKRLLLTAVSAVPEKAKRWIQVFKTVLCGCETLSSCRLQGWAVVCMADRKGRGPIT